MAATLDARLDVRLPNQLKEIIQQAAELNGQSITDFVVSTLSETARRVVQRERLTVLSDGDRDIFLKMLDADAKPSPALRKAARWYRKHHDPVAD